MRESVERIAESLYDIGAVQFGEFRLKSGLMSPIYIDLRLLPSHPWLLRDVAAALACAAAKLPFHRIAGIPYAGLPIGVALSLEMDKPLIYPRKEAKEHGTRKAIEGEYKPGETVLVVDDLVSTGGAKIEAIEPLLAAGLEVQNVLVVVDREQGGREELAARGYTLHALFTLSQMLDMLAKHGKITSEQAANVCEYLRGSRC
mgnify:CR=1 FL=1